MPPPPPDWTTLFTVLQAVGYPLAVFCFCCSCFLARRAYKKNRDNLREWRKARKERLKKAKIERKLAEEQAVKEREEKEKELAEELARKRAAEEERLAKLKAARKEYGRALPPFMQRERTRKELRQEEETFARESEERRRMIAKLTQEEEEAVRREEERRPERKVVRKTLKREDENERAEGTDVAAVRERLLEAMTEKESQRFLHKEKGWPPGPDDVEDEPDEEAGLALSAEAEAEVAAAQAAAAALEQQQQEQAAIRMQAAARGQKGRTAARTAKAEAEAAAAEAAAAAESQNMLASIAGMFGMGTGRDGEAEAEQEPPGRWVASKPSGPSLYEERRTRGAAPTKVEQSAALTIQSGMRGMQERNKTRADRTMLHVGAILDIDESILAKAKEQEKSGNGSMLSRLESLAAHTRRASLGGGVPKKPKQLGTKSSRTGTKSAREAGHQIV